MYKTHVESIDRNQWYGRRSEVESVDEIGCWNMNDN